MTGDEGAIAISELLKKSPDLEDFRCSSTRVGTEGGVALSDALSKCTLLKKLDLRDDMFSVEAGLALDPAAHAHVHRKKAGGYRGQGFTEGWVEFTNKVVAKRTA